MGWKKMQEYKLYNGEVTLKFDESKHLYMVDDKIVYGVTSACGVLDKPALKQWAVNMGVNYLEDNLKLGMTIDEINKTKLLQGAKYAHKDRLTQAADIGTAVHLYLETYLKAGINKQPLPPLPINKYIKKGVEAFLEWAKEHKVKFLSSERKIYSKEYGYAGTADGYALVDGKKAVIDFKTSSGIYDDMFLQTSAYAKAIEEEDNVKIEECWILRIPKDGSVFGTAKDINIDMNFRSFLGCLENYKRIRYLKGEQIKESKIKLEDINGSN
jgi:hypothetical protein